MRKALADGYKLGVKVNGTRIVTDCIAHPTLGAMGYHYFKQERFDDARIKELKPEALVYHTGKDGKLVLRRGQSQVAQVATSAFRTTCIRDHSRR